MKYGKQCVCGHGQNAHRCIERNGTWKHATDYFACNCGCHAVVRKGKEGKHRYRVYGCKEYRVKE